MKLFKFITLPVLIALLLVGCSSDKKSDMEKFLAQDKDKYALFVVGEELDLQEFESENIRNIESIFNASSLKRAKDNYPFLELKKSPTFIVFNHEEKVYSTDNFSNLIEYLKTNKDAS
ncbi:hypothetical protein [Bacillus sp. E(2018)]|uniref:hypothetical protein n=1 Tax=Bacillus sp. E(2018) TaxID=2502239 RepID=UPI0010F555BE|nr:hypothetical protein [Bacillus sp. E(2018)]